MKDELQLKLVEILTSIQNTAGKAGDFAMTQLPDIAQSYVVYGRVSTTLAALISLLVFLVAWIGIFRAEKAMKQDDSYNKGAAFFFGGAISIVPFLIFLTESQSALLVWFAPKVWLLREIAALIK